MESAHQHLDNLLNDWFGCLESPESIEYFSFGERSCLDDEVFEICFFVAEAKTRRWAYSFYVAWCHVNIKKSVRGFDI